MDGWCPRCEWVGVAPGVTCPRCATPLVALERAKESPSPPLALLRPPASEVVVEGAGALPAPRRRRRRRWAPVMAAVAIAALVAAGLHQGRPPGGTRATPVEGFPSRLAYLRPADGATGETLVLARGDGRDPARDLRQGAGSGLAGPADPERLELPQTLSVPSAVDFAWAPDGRHWLVVDATRHLRIFPSGSPVVEHVLDAAFSPDGRYVALCTGTTWPPAITIAPVSNPAATIAGSVAGCDPRWAPDGHYLAYRIPRRHTLRPGYDGEAFGVMNAHLGLGFRASGRWPVAWAPSSHYVITPVTAIDPSGNDVSVMDQRGGQHRVVVSSQDLRRATGGLAPGAVLLVAWSPDASTLAVAVTGSPRGAPPGVVEFDPFTGSGAFVPGPGPPSALAWSRTGSLLVQFDPPSGPGVSDVVEPDGHVDHLGRAADGTWSPDGRLVLARTGTGWFAFDPRRAASPVPMGSQSSQWLTARWCCPPSQVVDSG